MQAGGRRIAIGEAGKGRRAVKSAEAAVALMRLSPRGRRSRGGAAAASDSPVPHAPAPAPEPTTAAASSMRAGRGSLFVPAPAATLAPRLHGRAPAVATLWWGRGSRGTQPGGWALAFAFGWWFWWGSSLLGRRCCRGEPGRNCSRTGGRRPPRTPGPAEK
jgi:hypothetical protein